MAPVLLVPISERVVFANDLAFEVEDDSAAVENVLLAITALGYASVWMDGDVKRNGAGEKLLLYYIFLLRKRYGQCCLWEY